MLRTSLLQSTSKLLKLSAKNHVNMNHMTSMLSNSLISKRNMSTTSNDIPITNTTSTINEVVASNSTTISEIVNTTTDVVVPTLGTSPSHYVMTLIDNIHHFTGLPYWETIILMTFALRIILFPVAMKGIINSAKLAILRPDLQKIQERMSTVTDNGEKQRLVVEIKALYEKHQVNPFKALLTPLLQIPIFITFYFALNGMAEFFPALATGGAFWFHDLTKADPYYILPVLNGLSFLAMIELGADGMASNDPNMRTTKWVMRGMGIFIIPVTIGLPESVFMYWTANNAFSITQTLLLKNPKIRERLGIPKLPTPDPNQKPPKSPLAQLREIVENKPQTIDAQGVVSPPPPPAGPAPVTFARKPTKPKKN